ncbi:hypothetical protein JAAARDRAFT_156781 [Jaapia argillacea MUCL 33604]|uniref:RING-type domain-containing protein n=1 Tax=Jaapia argillacea MUCL 33604 TaxID=933084 RepID=A0A067PSR0_9AGAM|nr:hypothetical protein JAAARDRAFT_156781 [Jaapia argillacea MUCL 33604]
MASSSPMSSSYSYVGNPDQNLLCCICRMPFKDPTRTRTCCHTFCYQCISHAMEISLLCPVDRSPLASEDLVPADPIVRNLVEELEVECSHKDAGCSYTCQRQLLASHLKDQCEYVEVPCGKEGCGHSVPRKDLKKHKNGEGLCESCSGVKFEETDSHQSTYSQTTPPTDLSPCPHSSYGCQYTGSSTTLETSHLPTCPYESIKHFFPVHESRLKALTNENAILKIKTEALEGVVRVMQKEMEAVRWVLGPWWSQAMHGGPILTNPTEPIHGSSTPPQEIPGVNQIQPARNLEVAPELMFDGLSLHPAVPPPISPSTDDLAPYFPPVQQQEHTSDNLRPSLDHSYPSFSDSHPQPYRYPPNLPASSFTRPPIHHTHTASNPYAFSAGPSPSVLPGPQLLSSAPSSSSSVTAIAPLDLSSTLEGTLSGLRESVISLSNSVESLTRRNDIALNTENRMRNEEIRSLKVALNGVRMQVCNIFRIFRSYYVSRNSR